MELTGAVLLFLTLFAVTGCVQASGTNGRAAAHSLNKGRLQTSDINGHAAAHSFDKAKTSELKKLVAAAGPQRPAVTDHVSNRSSSSEDCTILTCGAKVPDWINGKYTKRSGTCNSRPAYQQTGTSEGTVYLYYWVGIVGGVSISTWDIGSPVCGDEIYATVFDNALTPDLITETWLEYNYNTGNMDQNHVMSTQCVSSNYNECSSGPPTHVTSLGLLIGTLLFSIVMNINIK